MKSTLLIGDCRDKIKEIPDESIDCVVTSPPYWGLRDYKTEPLIWDGAPDCEHEWKESKDFSQSQVTGLNGLKDDKDISFTSSSSSSCQKCGAWRGQIGLEPSPQLYIKHLTDIFDQVKRVLKPSGTCWVNLGDSYSGGANINDTKKAGGLPDKSLPDKCLVQIPSRFALEMTSRGWILRNEIIWHKPNCMPSSVTDRFTMDFEKVFFFVKSKKYYFKQQYDPLKITGVTGIKFGGNKADGYENATYSANEYKSDDMINGRNKRTVWTISTKPYSGSHFAVFPIDLIAPMIDAGCPKEICPKCGHAREIKYELGDVIQSGGGYDLHEGNPNKLTNGKSKTKMVQHEHIQSGMTDCGCNAGWIPGTVMDIFSGSGTVLEYARKHGLNGVGIELNPKYEALAVDRALLNIPPITNYKEAIDEIQN